MISLSTRTSLGAAAAVLALVAVSAVASPAVAAAVALSVLTAVCGCVAFVAQSRRFQDQQRLVYRPVYVRRHDDRRLPVRED